jgi:hypothetical protein
MTPATIAFKDATHTEVARLYVHGNGYAIDQVLARFFDVEKKKHAEGGYSLRWHDPSYLAARFVAAMIGGTGAGVGVVNQSDQQSWHWSVTCADRDKVPTVEAISRG